MLPRSLLFFIMIMGIDIILKSIRDKKKIQKDRDILKPVPKVAQRRNIPIEPKIVKPEFRKKDKIIEGSKPEETIQVIEDKIEEKRSRGSKEKLREDVLRGIIFSEVLSKPKALSRNRRSI